MSTDLSLFSLLQGASFMVQMVMLILLLASIASWAVIYNKWKLLQQSRKEADCFEENFWSGIDLSQLYKDLGMRHKKRRGMDNIFEMGFKEFARLNQQPGIDPMAVLEGAQRAMRVALSREIECLEDNLTFLATVGSISPYIGLFGTVWGIMNAFHSLGDVQQATLAMVAPGIAEALVATAMGLFAAIPAVIAYNRYSNDTERLENKYDNFLEEFSSVLQRQPHEISSEEES
ncbi:MAG: protein TolQ [Gammaproteobacteria bacterium]|nr:protein TolQ [Gammaproteobacteria bacterium]